jgi:hypothetical protein
MVRLVQHASSAASPPLGPALPPIPKAALGELDLAGWGLLRSLLEARERQQDLAVPSLRREEKPEAAGGSVRAHLIDVAP